MLKAAVSVALAAVMVAGMVPSAVNGIFGSPVKAAEEGSAANPLMTIWKTAEIGTHTDTGTYLYNGASKEVTIEGAGTKFDKDGGMDDLFYAYFAAKGNITVSAKMSVTGSGQAGLLIKNNTDDQMSAAASVYADMSKGQIRYGYHVEGGGGGASQITGNVTPSSTDIYVRVSVDGENIKCEAATQPDFSDAAAKTKAVTGLDAKTVGFFATEGMTLTLSDVEVTSQYTTDDGTFDKVIFDSEIGELGMIDTNSGSYRADKYDAGNTIEKVADGNMLKVTQTRSAAVKGNIREDIGVDYMLFPATSEDMTITADVTVNTLNSGTDKQGIAIGQFSTEAGRAVCCDTLHIMKNLKVQHTYATEPGKGACGAPNGPIELGTNYTMTYTKSGNTAIMKVVAADGTVVVDNTAEPYDLSLDAEGLREGTSVQYGFAFTGVSADLSNIRLINSAGQIVYDMNDYYIAVGVAPVIANVTAAVADDRESIELAWDVATEGSGSVKYSVYVSKDGGEYTKIGDSKVNTFTFKAMSGDGKYTFKVVPYGGDTAGVEQVSAAADYQTPLARTELTAAGTEKQVSLTWTAVDGAASYDVYKALGSDGEFSVVKSTADLSYVDTAVNKEEPYYYYVVAKNDNNTSNPSVTMQVLTSDGHTGAYVYESEATKVEVVDKSNDTIFDTQAFVTMKTDEDCTAKLIVNGSEVSSKAVKAEQTFTLMMNLAQGRNDVEVLFTDADGKTTRKIFNFVSNPVIDMVVDSAFSGTDGDVVDGYATYKTVQAAVNSVAADNTESKVIFIKNGEYEERVEVKSPYVSLLGEDAEKTHLFKDVCVAGGSATGMWDRNAFYVDSTADGFTAENLTIENTYAYTNGSDQQADALCIVADKTACINVRLVGYQDTLLTDTRVKDASGNYEVTRQYFGKCYITGNVDFIYGAGTSTFEDCDIVARYTPYKADGCFTAARTYSSIDCGYVFNNCRFLAEDGVADGSYRIARPWGADASTTFINCYLGRALSTLSDSSKGFYGDMSGNSYKDARFAEYGSYGPAFAVNNDRPYLTAAQAAKFATAAVMGDYDYANAVAGMYKEAVVPPTEEETTGSTENDTTGAADSTESETAGSSVETGDRNVMSLYILLAVMAGLAIMGAAYADKKRRA